MNDRPMDGGVEPSMASAPSAPAAAPGQGFGAVLEWFGQWDALASARAKVASEPQENRTRRERCRALWDAAEQLSANARTAPEAQSAIHAEALKAEAIEPPQGLDALRARHEALLAELESAQRSRTLAWRNRLNRVSGLLLVAVAVTLGGQSLIERLSVKPNLLEGKTWKTSTTAGTCKPAEHSCAGVTTDIFFHTNYEPSPWIEYDLGAPTTFSRLFIRNRQDSLPDRAIPLVAEASDDEKTWKSVAKRDQSFSEWSVGFPPVTARYFRLRVEKPTWFHLEAVELKP